MSKTATRYLLYVFLFSYSVWGIIILGQQFGYFSYGTPIMMILWLLGGIAPAISSFIVLKKTTGISLRMFLKDAFSINQKWSYYILLPLFLLLFFGIPMLFGNISGGAPWYIGFALIPLMIIGGGIEELGWRMILQPEFEKKQTFTVASILTSIIWLFWHLPLFFIFGTTQATNTSFLVFSISIFGLSFALAATYRISKSIWLCILFHASANALSSIFPVASSWQSALATSIAMIILSLLLIKQQENIHL